MKTKLLSFLAASAAFLTLLGGLDLSGFVSILPHAWAAGFATALPLMAGVVHLIKAVGDFADDGQINDSFKCPALIFAIAVLMSLLAVSCAPSAVWSVHTPYGDATSNADGSVTVTPRPIVIPVK